MAPTPVPVPRGRFTIGKRFRFEAGHRLLGLPPGHKCARQHGHSFEVEVVLTASALEAPGFVTDFGALAPFKNFLDTELDHHNLHEVLPIAPTSELLAQFLAGWFIKNVQDEIPGRLIAVLVREQASSWARFDVEAQPDRGNATAGKPAPRHLAWADIDAATQALAEQVVAGGVPQAVVGVVRGGMVPAVCLAHRLGIRDVRAVEVTRTASDGINAAKDRLPTVRNAASLGDLTGLDVLLVDDIAGSGATLAHTADLLRSQGPARIRTAVLTVNRANWTQDAEPDDVIDYIASLNDTWIVFPWEDQHEH
jgi:hypoxanthine phosphoribosyltransferase